MKYFDFFKLEQKLDIIEPFLVVLTIYTIIFTVAWVYNRFPR